MVFEQMNESELQIRTASQKDIDALNRVVEAAVKTWNLPERVKRLALPSYRYNEHDFEHYEIVVAESGNQLVGVAAWDTVAQPGPEQTRLLFLHGLYVLPEQQRSGIGSRLLAAAEMAVRKHGFDGIVVKVQKGAEAFFKAQGLGKLGVSNQARDYENQYWKRLA